MAHAVIMPKAGMSMVSGTILKWLKREGDEVAAGEPILEIETDKVEMEVEAEASGVLLRIVRQEGEEVPVTETIAYIGLRGEDLGAELGPGHAPAEETVPGSTAADALRGQSEIRANHCIAATPLARTLAAQRGVALSSVKPSGPRGEIKARDIPAEASGGKIIATPLARRLAGLESIDLARLKGSGRSGKITKRDVLEHRSTANPPAPAMRRTPMSAIRRRIAQRVAESHATVPPVTLNAEADVTALRALKAEFAEQTGAHYSLNDFILRAVTLALRAEPALMRQLDGDELLDPPSVDLGVAVSADELLFVAVIRGAESLSFAELVNRAHELIDRAREHRLSPEEVGGATFTVTNLGMYGIVDFTPIINPPQSAILGVGAVREVLQLVEGEPRSRSKITLSLTIDHRIIDGVAGARFLSTVRQSLEQPMRLLL